LDPGKYLKNVKFFNRYFINSKGIQIDTNINMTYMKDLHEVCIGQYFQNFSQ